MIPAISAITIYVVSLFPFFIYTVMIILQDNIYLPA